MVDYVSMIPGMTALGAMFGAFFAASIAISIILYVYFAFAWMTIGKKMNYKYPWLAWIPFAQFAMIYQLGGLHWAWVFVWLLPVLGWIAGFVLLIIGFWKIFKARKYPAWLSLLCIGGAIPAVGFIFPLAFYVVLGLVAWKDR
ncbi:MAG: hypothetical protein KJ709_06730 [Nanoarchaeota archaeon]|nr:hypothetical protein [Nanoarchaeota archaeon]